MKLFILVIVYIPLMLLQTITVQTLLAKPGCQERCGKVTVQYPYGIGTDCYLHKSFEVLCTGSSQDPAPLQFVHNHEFPILRITMESVHVVGMPAVTCDDSRNRSVGKSVLDRHFSYSHDRNIYVGRWCDVVNIFAMSIEELGCSSGCLLPPFIRSSTCKSFNGCCHRNVPIETKEHIARKNYNFPVALDWVIGMITCHQAHKTGSSLCGQNSYCVDATMGRGYNCRCTKGYKGNPYLPSGCKDINECLKQNNYPCGSGERCVNTPGSYKCTPHHHKQTFWGIVATLIVLSAFSAIGYWAFIQQARRKKNMIKRQYFIRNGGHLLKQQISANKSCVMKINIHATEEMEKATKRFNRKQILGKGGQGTVYKGLLSDGTVVAIKKLNAVDEDHVKQFVNELLILAQINHRNVVKLLGCCLEYEFPLLVYEYLSNGTLSQHLHDGTVVSKFSWKDRIRIAREVAEALAYLHSYASSTIFHRDIKPVNILLDENFKAVISDFGLSRSVPLSRTHLTTQIEGTFGYLDPEYFESGQFSAKSDVYAFGVVLTELLTRRKSVSSTDCDKGLIPQFMYLMKHNRAFEILDKQIVEEAWIDDVFLVTKIAKRCMKRNAKKRPNMKEVVTDLDKLKLV